MNLKDWCSAERGRASWLAKAADIPPSFLSQMVAGDRPVPPAAAVSIERATNSEVSRQELRPSDWEAIWPELSKPAAKGRKKSAPAEQEA